MAGLEFVMLQCIEINLYINMSIQLMFSPVMMMTMLMSSVAIAFQKE